MTAALEGICSVCCEQRTAACVWHLAQGRSPAKASVCVPQATPYYDMAPLADAGLSSSSESTCGSASTDDENAQNFGRVFFAEPSPKRSRSGEEGGGPQLM